MWRSHCNSRRLDFSWKTSVLRPFFRMVLQSLETYIVVVFLTLLSWKWFSQKGMKLLFLWHSKVLLLSTVSLNTFYFDTFCNFWKKESVSLKEGCNEKKNTKGVSPLTMTDSPIGKTFTGNVSSTYNFCFSSDQNLPHALGLGRMASTVWKFNDFPITQILREIIFWRI